MAEAINTQPQRRTDDRLSGPAAGLGADEPRRAPAGLGRDQWDQFMRDGFLALEGAIDPDTVAALVEAVDRHSADGGYRENIVELDPVFAEVINADRHIGLMYDVYGELTQLLGSSFLTRPRGGWFNAWHPDGARAVPYAVYAGEMPMQIKVGYWLTDCPEPRMGNFVCMPGSHRTQVFEHYDTHESLPGELVFCPRAGDMTLMHCSLWHRVEPNETDVVRKNLFYSYSPSWVVPADRYLSDPQWLSGLSREQRILMRSYATGYERHKPPAADFPLFLDRETGADRDPGYPDHVELHRRKRRAWVEDSP